LAVSKPHSSSPSKGPLFLPHDTCWICEGWQQANFHWVPGVSGTSNVRPIYIHAEFEAFKPRYLGKMDHRFRFAYKRMVPFYEEGKFYFTVEGK
jgi:hypothetical protein